MAKSGDEVEHLLEAANMMRKVNNAGNRYYLKKQIHKKY